MKKYFSILLIITFLLALPGCDISLETFRSREAFATETGTYMTNLSQAVADTKKVQNKNTFTFIFCTDLHYSSKKGNSGNEGLNTIKAINSIIENCPIDFAEMNGDNIHNINISNDDMIKDMNTLNDAIYRKSKFFL